MSKRVGNHFALYNSGGIALSDGDETGLFVDEDGYLLSNLGAGIAGENLAQDVLGVQHKPVVSSVYTTSSYFDIGTQTKDSVTTVPTQLFSLRVSNANAAVRYFQIHNKASDPAGTEVPLKPFLIPAGTAAAPAIIEIGENYFGSHGKHFTAGLAWAISTTGGTFTDSATANEHTVTIEYV